MLKRISLLILLAVTFVVAASAAGKTIRVLAIGNSFSEDAVENYLYELGVEAGYELVIGNAYRPGQGLESHWNDITKANNTFEYRKIVKGELTNTKKNALKDILLDEAWDYITFQQVSQDSGRPETYEPFLANLIDYVKTFATNPKVKFGFHMTWAYSQDSTHGGFKHYDNNQQTMYSAILGATRLAMTNHDALNFVIPSGTAIQNARTSTIGDHMNRDGYHLELKYGRYTAACAWVETLTGKNVSKLSYRPEGVDAETARLCRKAAHKAIKKSWKVTTIK